jgi:hypothetical protein
VAGSGWQWLAVAGSAWQRQKNFIVDRKSLVVAFKNSYSNRKIIFSKLKNCGKYFL